MFKFDKKMLCVLAVLVAIVLIVSVFFKNFKFEGFRQYDGEAMPTVYLEGEKKKPHELLPEDNTRFIFGHTVPPVWDLESKKIPTDEEESMLPFKHNDAKPECCVDSAYSTSTGCVCMTKDQKNKFIPFYAKFDMNESDEVPEIPGGPMSLTSPELKGGAVESSMKAHQNAVMNSS